MSDQTRELWVNTQLRGRQLDEFLAIKEYLGIQTNADVVRHLIHKQARAIRRRALYPTSPNPQSPNPQSPNPSVPQSATESLCLSCPLPDCDESDARCLYQQATGERERKRARMRAYIQRQRAAGTAQAAADGEA